ncbi:unnamed protein product [Larinioides sclopetarius]|uniref:Uncharacterized protein n=1 Tax=Larinioides sclopetarius TaxID=280406 RepID=A0AAV1YTZ2_9ARAC
MIARDFLIVTSRSFHLRIQRGECQECGKNEYKNCLLQVKQECSPRKKEYWIMLVVAESTERASFIFSLRWSP